MSTTAATTEITSPVASAWTQIDGTPLSGRKYAQVANQDLTQRMGVIFTHGSAPTGAWNTGLKVLPGDMTPLEPCEGAVKIYVRMETGPVTTGDAVLLLEWN